MVKGAFGVIVVAAAVVSSLSAAGGGSVALVEDGVAKCRVAVAEVAVARMGDRWTVEVAVPTDEIGSKCLPGQVWRTNVCRQRGSKDSPRESSSVCNGVFYGPGNFVNLKFVK